MATKTFQVVGGHRGPGGVMSGAAEVVGKGEKVESDLPLDKMFVNAYIPLGDGSGPKTARQLADEEPTPQERDAALGEVQRGKGKKAAPKKGKAPAKGAKPAKDEGDAPEDEEESEDGEDVTDQFPLAVENDLKVFKGKKGTVVKDGKKTLNDEPLKTKKQVRDFLDEHLGAKEGDE